MFGTYDSAEIPIPAPLAGNGERLWSYAHLQIQVPWFYVQYSVDLEDRTHSSVLFLSTHDQLLDLAGKSDLRFSQVNLVSPAYINKSGQWKMEPLKEIWHGTNRSMRESQEVTMYVLEDGRWYFDGECSDRNALENFYLAFAMPASR